MFTVAYSVTEDVCPLTTYLQNREHKTHSLLSETTIKHTDEEKS